VIERFRGRPWALASAVLAVGWFIVLFVIRNFWLAVPLFGLIFLATVDAFHKRIAKRTAKPKTGWGK
jgi:hypothetical protein